MSDPDEVAQNKPIPVPEPGGDTSGQYMFASLAELDNVIANWHAEGDNIEADGQSLNVGKAGAGLGLYDVITSEYMSTLDGVFAAFVQHNGKMYEYNAGYAEKLTQCRQAMSGTEQSNSGKFSGR